MNDDYLREQAARVRQIASFADPFTKKRLLALAERYDAAKPTSRTTPLPSITMDGKQPPSQQNRGDTE
jgi:hypothetical protein